MTASTLLVRIPGTPFSINDLRPHTGMATLAGRINAGAQTVTILDYGTVETIEELYPARLRSQVVHWAERLQSKDDDAYDIETGLRYTSTTPKALTTQHEKVWKRIGEKIAARRDFDLVVFTISHEKDYKAARVAANRIRALLPRAVIGLWGPPLETSHELVAKSLRCFDAVLLGETCQGLSGLAEYAQHKSSWCKVPCLGYLDGVRFTLTPPGPIQDAPPPAPPTFDSRTYEGLHGHSKLRIFDIKEVHLAYAHTGEQDPVQKPVEAILKELEALRGLYRAHAVHFADLLPASDHPKNLAQELMARNSRIRYSRETHIGSTDNATVTALSASGCHAVDFRIDSGSQRLLERYYGHPFVVTEIERVLRRCNFSGLFTATRYTFPCPDDDYHTQAETLRLIQRSDPDSVMLALPHEAATRARRSLLFHEFAPILKSARRRSAQRNSSLRREIEEMGIATGVSARFALLADLAGHKGRESQFTLQLANQLLTGDAFGISSMIERVNHASSEASNAFQFKPFVASQDAVAN